MISDAGLNKFKQLFGTFLIPLHSDKDQNGLHWIDCFESGKHNKNYLIFNLIEPLIDFEQKTLPLTEIKLWSLSDENKGLNYMQSCAWSSNVKWIFFFTPDEKVFLKYIFLNNYSLCVDAKYFIPFLSMFYAGELQKYFTFKLEQIKNKEIQLAMF
jgi:hypothetical protein